MLQVVFFSLSFSTFSLVFPTEMKKGAWIFLKEKTVPSSSSLFISSASKIFLYTLTFHDAFLIYWLLSIYSKCYLKIVIKILICNKTRFFKQTFWGFLTYSFCRFVGAATDGNGLSSSCRSLWVFTLKSKVPTQSFKAPVWINNEFCPLTSEPKTAK